MKKTIIVGVSGGIAAFKAVQLVSDLVKCQYDVEVIMTKNACEFIAPLSFEALTQHTVMVDTFDHRFEKKTQHISVAKKADAFILAPASANVIAKVANGLADDMLTTTFLACNCQKLIAPAMNTNMYNNPITQDNLNKCRHYGMKIIEPISGHLACGDEAMGKLADVAALKEAVIDAAEQSDELRGKRVLITCGATQEAIDPVRYITNHSSGKMGTALAMQAKRMGADVTLIAAHVETELPRFIPIIKVENTAQMLKAVQEHYDSCDILIKAAAVSDYRCQAISDEKIKKQNDTFTLSMVKNPDILKWCGEHKTHQILVGFAMETQNLMENALKKCKEKNCDLLVANNLKQAGAGFKHDTNIITLIQPTQSEQLTLMSKEDCAKAILQKIKEEFLC